MIIVNCQLLIINERGDNDRHQMGTKFPGK